MRLDLFLKCVCLAKSRSMASKSIDEGKVLAGGAKVKASREVKPGDVLEIVSRDLVRKIKVLDVPQGQTSKAESKDFYAVLDESRISDAPW